MTKAAQILALLQSYAPSTREQFLVSKWSNEVRLKVTKEQGSSSSATELVIEKTLINALSDGVNHGNWPWTENSN